jgi:DNA-binding transcriptional ArsR family regulator
MSASVTYRRLDARALIGIAHPLRVRIRDRLRREGPATATQLARAFGESSGATSYHLRMLARYGLVERDPDHGKGRERWWRATPDIFQIQLSELLDDSAARDALRVVSAERHQLSEERLLRWLTERERWSQPWRDGAETTTAVAHLSVEQMTALRDELSAVIERFVAEPPAAEAKTVEIELNVFPTGEPA